MTSVTQSETDAPLADVTIADAPTVFRAFERGEFLEWPAWWRLRRILGANGGSYGLAGPRGAGKSWLMLRAIEWTEEPEDIGRRAGIGLWYPSPSEYDPLAFLASLSDSLASKIEWRYRHLPVVIARMRLLYAVLALAFIAATVAVVAIGVGNHWSAGTYALGAVAGLALVAIPFVVFRVWRSFWPEYRLLKEALIVRERARYTATQRESTELGGQGGGGGVVARARRVRERQLVERPATLSSLVNDFRALAQEAGRVTGGLVIAIDELDKMSDPEKVRALLRDIKAIFEVPCVHFLVSVSDEAARNLSLGVLGERNEFNSSFYTVVEAQPATPQDCAELLERRGSVPREVSLVLAVLAGGNPREVVRLAELAGSVTTGREAAMAALREEALGLRREVVTAVNARGVRALGHEPREATFLALPDEAFEESREFAALCRTALESGMWDPPWRDAGWTARFEEAWRRLMVRLAVAGRLADSRSIVRDKDLTERLLDVVTAAGQSAQVAKIVLDRNLRIDARRAPADAPSDTEIRDRFTALARRYESTRASMSPGSPRTSEMDTIAQQARRLAQESPYTTDELLQLLRSPEAGERVVALAIVQGTAVPETFPEVLAIVAKPVAPFEQYHALRALESLRPNLAPPQRHEVHGVLSDVDWRTDLGGDSSRLKLADRILKGLEHDSGPPPKPEPR